VVISETGDNIVIEPMPDSGRDKYLDYQEIDLFRRIMASLLQAPKSGSATELTEKLLTYIVDDAILLKRAQVFERVEATMSAAALLRHVLDCGDCKTQQVVCARLEEMKTYIEIDASPENAEQPASKGSELLGRYTTKSAMIPNQRYSHNH
jgi:hypothetical protein